MPNEQVAVKFSWLIGQHDPTDGERCYVIFWQEKNRPFQRNFEHIALCGRAPLIDIYLMFMEHFIYHDEVTLEFVNYVRKLALI